MTSATKALLDSLNQMVAEYPTVSPKTDRAHQLQLGGSITKTAKELWKCAGREMATLSQDEIAAVQTAFEAAQNQQHFFC